MIDKDLLRRQLKDAQERRASGFVSYVKEDTTLRILPFTDASTGKALVAREFRQWRPKGEGRPVAHRGNWGKPDLFEAVRQQGGEFTWRETTAYLVNGIDVASGEAELRTWQLPASVYEAIVEILLDDEFADVLDPKSGMPFKIKRSGAGLKTKYSVMVGQKAVDVSRFVKQVKDPLTAVEDPGLERQADALGVDVSEFDLEEPAPEPVAAKKKPAKAAPVAEETEDEEEGDDEPLFPPAAPAAKAKATGATSIRDLLKKGGKG